MCIMPTVILGLFLKTHREVIFFSFITLKALAASILYEMLTGFFVIRLLIDFFNTSFFCWLSFLMFPSVNIPVVKPLLFLAIKIPNFFEVIILSAFFKFSFSLIKGIFFPITIKSSTDFNFFPRLPAGWYFEKSYLLNFFLFKATTARASPIANFILVLDVGTIPRPASLTSGIRIFISEP